MHKQAAQATQKAVIGEIQDIHQVAIAGQKAILSLQLRTAIRSKMLESYQEIMRM